MRVLVIEDEQKALAYIKKGLEEAAFSSMWRLTARKA